MSVRICRHLPGERLLLQLFWDGPSSHESDRTVVLELRDPGREVVDRAAKAVGRLTEERVFQIWVQLPRREPGRYVARLEIHQPDAPPRPLVLPDPTPLLAATLSLAKVSLTPGSVTQPAATAAPGDKLRLTVYNTGLISISFGERYDLQRWRQDATGWGHVNREDCDLMVSIELPPGSSHERWVKVPRRARPGHHRIVKEFASQWAHGTVRASVEFDVVARTSQ